MREKLLASLLPLLVLLLVLPPGLELVYRLTAGYEVRAVALGDVDGDGHLDAFLVNGGGSAVQPPYVLLNDGRGRFGGDVRALEQWPGDSAALGDLNGDGYADALLGLAGGSLVLYHNDGSGDLADWSYLTRPMAMGVMWVQPLLADLNNDGQLDIFAAGCCGREGTLAPGNRALLPYSQVWLYNEAGKVEDSYDLGNAGSNGAALADLNGDGSLDAFLANGRTLQADETTVTGTPNTVWFNDGEGRLRDSGQQLGAAESMAVALGDVNGDGTADAVVGNRGPDEVWLNDGRGFFRDGDQQLGSELTEHVFLEEVNGDGHLDLLQLGAGWARVWLNDGRGKFSAGQTIRYGRDATPAVGDVTGDGWVDLFAADVTGYRVWHGEGNGRFVRGAGDGYR